MRTADFHFDLPADLIAQTPALQRDSSRLLVLHRIPGKWEHRHFPDLVEYMQPGDVLVLNDSRVIPARLRGRNLQTGGQFEILLLEENSVNDWWVMLRPGKRARVGTQINLLEANARASGIQATVMETNAQGHRRLRFVGTPNLVDQLESLGEVPLPPYIRRAAKTLLESDRRRYQTVYALRPGSVAAPTAGLHFTDSLLNQFQLRGVHVCFLTLHVGLGTFAPVKTETLASHTMHAEAYTLSEQTAQVINQARQSGGRIFAVGTTTLRVLESAADPCSGQVIPRQARTQIFIYPPCQFKIVDGLVTNFHLPRSTLLMLVSAFAAPNQTRGRDLILAAYSEAVHERYRFFSYGDAMLIL